MKSRELISSAAIQIALALVGLLLTTSWTSLPQAQGKRNLPPPRTIHKIVAPQDLLDTQAHTEALQEYGAFSLYRLSEEALSSLPSPIRAQTQVVDYMDRLEIAAHPFDTQRESLSIPSTMASNAEEGDQLHLVQFYGPIKSQWLAELSRLGLTPIHYVAHNGYLVWSEQGPILPQQRQALLNRGTIQYSTAYHPYFKVDASLRARILDDPDRDAFVPIDLQVYDHANVSATKKLLASLTNAQTSPWTRVLDYQNAQFVVHNHDLLTIARLSDVVWLGEHKPRERMDEVQGQILAGNLNSNLDGPSGPGYLGWLTSHALSTNPDDYPIVDITDDGIGNGSTLSGDASFHQMGNTSNPTRLAYVANCTDASSGGGPDGHGHINTSIAGGYDTHAGFPYRDPGGYQRGLGMSPYGRLAGTRVFNDEGSFNLSACGGSDTSLIKSTEDQGALISSNSWGCGACAGTYDASSQAYDVGVRDADQTEAGNQELIVIFSAGNDGPDSASVGTPGNAKNVITVGASESHRLADEDGSWTDGCLIGPSGSDDAMDVISFSSRGPAPGGRIKPEIVAPGTHIQGTASTHPGYTGESVCDKVRPSGQTLFAASSGTSHSTPAVAGIASLYTHWLETTYGLTPSPALMKAYLVAHPTYLTGTSANDTLPSNNQGFGMPNLSLGLDDADRLLVDQTHRFDESGETWTWQGAVSDPTRPVRIVLAYTDKAGLVGTSPEVNDLNLSAMFDGSSYQGNTFSGRWSTTGGTPDASNNYEAIFLPAGTSGQLDLTVTAFNIADDGVPNVGDNTDQDFALVCYNCIQDPDFSLEASPDTQSICAGDSAAYEINLIPKGGFAGSVTLSTSDRPAGTSASFDANPVVPPGSSQLLIDSTEDTSTRDYPFSVIGEAPGPIVRSDDVMLRIYWGAPDAATPVTPENGSVDQPARPEFTWQPVPAAESYGLQLATDPAFANPLLVIEAIHNTSYTPTASLDPGTVYYWRLRATNPCATSTYSPVASFRTVPSASHTLCQDPNLAIPDGNLQGIVDEQVVTQEATISDLDVALQVSHSWVGDLSITLENMDRGQTLTLIDRPGYPDASFGCSGDDISASLDDEGSLPAEDACQSSVSPALSGRLVPDQLLSAFDNQALAGTWRLRAIDHATYDTGTLEEWCLEATSSVSEPTDYSDLGSSYGVAWHTGEGALRLGTSWTPDNSFLMGQDNGSDDGIALDPSTPWLPGSTVNLFATVSGESGRLKAWLDWNNDGDFDTGEQALDQNVNQGVTPLNIVIPLDAGYNPNQSLQGRFRLVSNSTIQIDQDAQATGGAASGEVEDHILEPYAPTAVTLARFEAIPQASTVCLKWETSSEQDILGFHLYRATQQDQDRLRLNEQLIPAQGLGSIQGASYTWCDPRTTPGQTQVYWLQAVGPQGGGPIYGPILGTPDAELRCPVRPRLQPW